jgi:protein-tyrosine sulfotransferase
MYIYTLMYEHVQPAERLCAKDPDTLYFTVFLKELFPNAKFILMVRDARATVYSLLKLYGEPVTYLNARKYLNTWNGFYDKVKKQCDLIGDSSCMLVQYESLILNTEKVMRRVAHFLRLPWTENFLRHEQFVGKKIQVSDTEWSTDQIKKKLYASSLLNWRNKVVYDCQDKSLNKNCVMRQMGYDLSQTNYDYLKEK